MMSILLKLLSTAPLLDMVMFVSWAFVLEKTMTTHMHFILILYIFLGLIYETENNCNTAYNIQCENGLNIEVYRTFLA